MTQLGCFAPIMACRTRISREDAAGFPLVGANDLVVSGLVKISWARQVKEGLLITKDEGCGNTCVRRQAPDKVQGMNLVMEFCKKDYELDEMMSGSRLVMVGGIVRGAVDPDIDEELTNYVSVEAWQEAWDGDERATDEFDNPLWIRHVFPKTSWVQGDAEASATAGAILYTGRAYSNSNFGTGPGDDLPDGEYVTPHGEYVDETELPDANCGYALASGS